MDQKHKIKLSVEGVARLDGMRREVQSTFSRLDSAALKLTGVLGALAGVGGIGLLIDKNVEAARSARAWADALDVPIERLTAMQSAFKTVGIDADKGADILKDAAEKIADAYRNGAGPAVEVLDSLGLSVEKINAMSPDQQLFAIASALEQVGTHGEKVQIMETMASDAAKLLPLLDNNAAKLRELMAEADKSGRTLTRIEADKLMQAGEATDRLNEAMQGLGQTLTLSIVGPLTDVISFATKAVGRVQTLGEQFANFIVGDGEVNTRLLEEEEKLTRLQLKHRNVRGETAKAAALAEVEAQQVVVENARKIDAELRARREDWLNGFKVVIDPPAGNDAPAGRAAPDQLAADFERLREGLLSEEQALRESYDRRAWIVDDAFERGLVRFDERNQMLAQLHGNYEQGLSDITEREVGRRTSIEANAQQHIDGLKQKSMSLGIGLLRTLGQESEGWAYAAIALQKGVAISQINIDAAKARVAAHTLYSLGPGGPAAVTAALAQIETARATSLGLTVATGLVEASNVSSGGGGLSSSGAPLPVEPISTPGSLASAGAATNGQQITVIVEGNIYANDDARQWLVDTIRQAQANDEIRVLSNG